MGVLMSDENGNLTHYAGTKLPTSYLALLNEINNVKNIQDNKVEKVEVIYDASGGIELNYGRDAGILGESTPLYIDFSKYKKLYVYTYQLGSRLVLTLDLTRLGNNSASGIVAYYGQIAGLATDTRAVMTLTCYINTEKSYFYVENIGYWNTGGYVNRNSNGDYFVNKIEGVY